MYGVRMAQHRRMLTIAVAVAMLAACSSGTPDLEAAQRDADAFSTTASERPDALGVMSHTVVRDVTADDGGVLMEFASDVTIHEGSVACFGRGEMRVGLAIREASSWSGAETEPTTVACTGEPVSLSLRSDLDGLNAASFRATLTSGTAAVATLALFGDAID